MTPARAVKKEEYETDEDTIVCIGVVPSRNIVPNKKLHLRDGDVVCVHGETILDEHPGNAAYRRLVNLNKGLYAKAGTLAEKLKIAKSIVSTVAESNGRFLERENDSGIITSLQNVNWKRIGESKAAEVTLNALREVQKQNTARTTPSSSASPVSAPVAKQPDSTPSPLNLIKLTNEQATKMKYPVGCPIWYNIHINAAKFTSSQSMSKKYSSLCDANIGLVKSISMDITTRNLLYEVCAAKIIRGVFKSSDGSGTSEEGLFLEDHLCYASKCPVLVQLDEPMQGEVVTCSFSNHLVDTQVEKSYMVAVCSKDSHMQLFQAVNENHVKYSPVDLVEEDNMDQKEAKVRENDKAGLESEDFEDEAGELVEPKEQKNVESAQTLSPRRPRKRWDVTPVVASGSAAAAADVTPFANGVVQKRDEAPVLASGQTTKQSIVKPTKSSAPPIEHQNQVKDTSSNLKPLGHRDPTNMPSISSTYKQSHPKPHMSTSSSNKRGYSLSNESGPHTSCSMETNSNVPMTACSPRWEAPTGTMSLNSELSRKRPISSPTAFADNVAKRTESSPQPPSKFIKRTDDDAAKASKNSEYLRLLGTLSDHEMKTSTSTAREVQLPSWLVSNEPSRNEVIEAINRSIEKIYQTTGCNIRIIQRAGLFLSMCANQGESDGSTRNAIELVENCLVKMIGREECRGRLLYDIARSYGNIKYNGSAVSQRNPLNSSERIWMAVLDLPTKVIRDGRVKEVMRPFILNCFQDRIHQARCTLIVCQDNFGAKLLRCRPYILVLGKQAKQVDKAVALVRKTLNQFMQNYAIDRANRYSSQDESSHLDNPTKVTHSPKSSASLEINYKRRYDHIAPRKVMIPSWLLSDPLYLKEVEAGLFGSEWCKEMKFLENTGCNLTRSQDYLLIRASWDAKGWPNIKMASNMIEDALLALLGAEESKSMLLYDLTKSYSRNPVDGIIHMRNPLNPYGIIWANFINLTDHSNFTPALTTRRVYEEMHRLRCTLKICRDSFGIEMRHCQPYVMILGRQKTDVAKAIYFIRSSINELQRVGIR